MLGSFAKYRHWAISKAQDQIIGRLDMNELCIPQSDPTLVTFWQGTTSSIVEVFIEVAQYPAPALSLQRMRAFSFQIVTGSDNIWCKPQ